MTTTDERTGSLLGEPVSRIQIELVSVDALHAIGAADKRHEDTSAVEPLSKSGMTPSEVVVTSADAANDGVVADDVGSRLADEHNIDLDRRLRRAKATGKSGDILVVELEDDVTERLIVLGLGDSDSDSARTAGAALAGHLGEAKTVLCAVTAKLSPAALSAFVEGLMLASYTFSRRSEQPDATDVIVRLAVASVKKAKPFVDTAANTALAVIRARDLANTPSNEKSPELIATLAQQGSTAAGVKCTVLDQAALERGKFGGLLAVGAGSVHEPRLVRLEYRGDVGAPRVVLVGKGITFDTGGLSLKPADGMPLMKTDMSGSATVLAVLLACQALNIRANVVGLLALAENMPSGASYRPGDVITHYGGTTSEVFNTDAEGRLVLADALAYAQTLSPDVVIDVATLTGAATLGLSRQFAALYSEDDGLADELLLAAEATNDRCWRMPLVSEYRSALTSEIADIAHVATEQVHAGSITAALFLQAFVGDIRWAHLDIAGPGRAEKSSGELTRGATGFGVRLLLRWLARSPHLW